MPQRFSAFFSLIAGALLATPLCGQPAVEPQASAPVPAAQPALPLFAAVVRAHFQAWDADGDGILEPDEVDRLTVDPAWAGHEAAAIATIKLAMRSKKDPIADLRLADLDAVSTQALAQDAELVPVEERAEAEGHDAPRAPVRVDTLQGRFLRAARSIQNTRRELFLDPTPDLDKFRQGRIGDCFFVSIVGAMVERDPQSIITMIEPVEEPEPGFRVSFGNGRSVTISPPTDIEIALASTTGDEGIWLPVLEKAFGALRMDARPEDRRALSMTDAIARGGSSTTSIQYLTGHRARSMRLRGAAENPDELATVKAMLVEALEANRLAGAGTDAEPGVPGISPNHAYAILAFDAETDTLKMWNPHGNTFRPKGKAGLEFGYPTRGGRFEVPLNEFVKTFRRLVVETDEPAPASKPRRRPRG